MFKLLRRDRKGFTLIELIVVIAIIGILALIAIPRLGGFRQSAEDTKLAANDRIVTSAVQMYIAENGQPPHDGADLTEYFDEATIETTSGTVTVSNVDIAADGSWTPGTD